MVRLIWAGTAEVETGAQIWAVFLGGANRTCVQVDELFDVREERSQCCHQGSWLAQTDLDWSQKILFQVLRTITSTWA